MQKDKHNTYSKEALLKLIKEGKSAPADMDEFDLEALEGLKLLDKPNLLNKLDAEIDSIITKEKKKKTVYYFSAAASLLLIIGLIFFFKNEVTPDITKNEKPITSVEKIKTSEESTLSNAIPAQPETQTTYEAKESEALAKKMLPTTKGSAALLTAQTSPPPVVADEKEQEGKDAHKQLEVSKADNYEESKVAVPQINQEQQTVATNEVETTNNNTINNGEGANVKSKKSGFAAGNTAQPTQAASAKANVPVNAAAAEKDVALSKNKSAGLSLYASDANKKTAAKNYKEPTFIGGDTTFAAYVKQNLKISSPANSGTIVVEFLVTKKGKGEEIKIIKSLNNCDTCSQDVIDLIKSIEKWAPATIDGNNSAALKKISIQYN